MERKNAKQMYLRIRNLKRYTCRNNSQRTGPPLKEQLRVLADPSPRKKSDAGSSKLKTDRNMRRIRRAISANLGKNSGVIFAAAGFKNVPKSAQNKVLCEMGKKL